jgi:hypothetical protein
LLLHLCFCAGIELSRIDLSKQCWRLTKRLTAKLGSVDGWVMKMIYRVPFFVMIRRLVVRVGDALFGIVSTVMASTAEPPLLNPLASLMKKILMYPAQVRCGFSW